MSGFKGDNLAEASTNMPWYKGFEVKVKKEKVKGHTLVDALEKVVRPPKRNDKKAFRMPVSGVYKIKGVGDVVTGRVEQVLGGCPLSLLSTVHPLPPASGQDHIGSEREVLPDRVHGQHLQHRDAP